MVADTQYRYVAGHVASGIRSEAARPRASTSKALLGRPGRGPRREASARRCGGRGTRGLVRRMVADRSPRAQRGLRALRGDFVLGTATGERHGGRFSTPPRTGIPGHRDQSSISILDQSACWFESDWRASKGCPADPGVHGRPQIEDGSRHRGVAAPIVSVSHRRRRAMAMSTVPISVCLA
jgi:hypothetical protein